MRIPAADTTDSRCGLFSATHSSAHGTFSSSLTVEYRVHGVDGHFC